MGGCRDVGRPPATRTARRWKCGRSGGKDSKRWQEAWGPALGLVLVAMVATAGGCSRGAATKGAQGKAPAGPTAMPVSVVRATRGSITEELQLTGTCEAYEEIDVVPEVAGKVVRVAKDVGQSVTAGEPLVQLDTTLVAKQRIQAEKGVEVAHARLGQAVEGAALTDRETIINIRQAEQGVAAAKEQLRKAEAAYKLTLDKCNSDIEQARVALASAQSQERDVLAGARSQEIAQAETAVRQAEADLALKQSDYNRYLRLHQQGAVAEATLDVYRTQYEVAQQAVRRAREALSLAREGARQEQRRLAQLGVERAEEQLRLAEAGRRQVEIAARDVQAARVGLRQAEENLRLAYAARRRYNVSLADVRSARAGVGQAVAGKEAARATERKYTIFAPISGVVAQRNVDIGEGASPGIPIMRIVNSNPIRVSCEVSELDIAKVKLNDEGTALVDGLPGMTFVGRVADISPQTREGQRIYVVRVEIDNPQGLIKAGMFARVSLAISHKDNVIVVDRDCLLERGTERRAFVVQNGEVKIRQVKTGITNGRQVEVTEGIAAGELLVVSGQAMLADGQKVKPVEKSATAGREPEEGRKAEAERPPAGPATRSKHVPVAPAPGKR